MGFRSKKFISKVPRLLIIVLILSATSATFTYANPSLDNGETVEPAEKKTYPAQINANHDRRFIRALIEENVKEDSNEHNGEVSKSISSEYNVTDQMKVTNKTRNLYSNEEIMLEDGTTASSLDDLTTEESVESSEERKPNYKSSDFIPKDYDKSVLPRVDCLHSLAGFQTNKCGGVEVRVYLNIRSVQQIDEDQDMVILDVDLQVEWIDGVLYDRVFSEIPTYNETVPMDSSFLDKIWKPDVFLDQARKAKALSLIRTPVTVELDGYGLITYTARHTVMLSCEMLYTYYPADTQKCEFSFRSYAYTSDELRLIWLFKDKPVYLQDPSDPNFDLQIKHTDRDTLIEGFRPGSEKKFDRLTFVLLARRKLSYHMVQTYLPSVFFIVITWLCFLIPPRMVEARIGVSMTTLLTLISMFDSVREHAPHAIDLWMVCCIFCVFTTLFEFTVLVWLRSKREKKEKKNGDLEKKVVNEATEKENSVSSISMFRRYSEIIRREKLPGSSDKYAFVLFFAFFTVFNSVYWTWLLIQSEYFSWSVNSTLNNVNDTEPTFTKNVAEVAI